MKIGSHQLPNNLILAPMAGVTDRPFRQLCREHGAGLVVSEMVSSDTSLYGSKKSLSRLDHTGEAGPIAVQIVGADPLKMAEAARVNVDLGAQIIDINMGCPAKKVCKVAAGSALLGNESQVTRILEAVVNAVDVPVTLKIRTGTDPEHRNAVNIARIAEQSGIQSLAIHGRTRACKYTGDAEYNTIRAVKTAVQIPIIANGDITSPKKAKQVLQSTGADGIMVGRAAQGRPWIFQEITHYLATGEALPEPSPAWIQSVLLGHLENLYRFYGDTHGVRIARKHIGWYIKTQEGAAAFRKQVNQVETTEQQIRLIKEFFERLSPSEELAA
ncbi:MAG: tRNA dihydrouridine synthase DusB [bacterium]